MSLEVCAECVEKEKTLYKCSKCSASLCMHSYRSHKCSDPNLGLRGERSARRNADITVESWKKEQRKNKNKFELEIREDLTFIVDYPWFPFTKLKGFIPIQRSNYPFESISDFRLDLYLEGESQKNPDPNNYQRRFEHENWVRYQYNSFIKNWGDATKYYTNPNNQRTTKYQLLIPQYADEDLELLKNNGITVLMDSRTEKELERVKKESLLAYYVKVYPENDELIVEWSDKVDKWFRDVILIFVDYMTIVYHEDSDNNSEILESFIQEGPTKIRIPYWAMFRAIDFWERLKEVLGQQEIKTIDFIIKRYIPKPINWRKLDKIAKKQFELRFYQQDALDIWKKNLNFASEQLPTGAGKTVIGIGAIWEVKERTLILVPNLDLVEQWKQRITSFLGVPESEIGIFSGVKKEFEKDIVISTYQLLSQYIQDYKIGSGELVKIKKAGLYDEEDTVVKQRRALSTVSTAVNYFRSNFGLLIADECHHVQASTFKEIALGLDIPKRLALSATIEWELNTSLIISAMGPVIYSITYGTLSKEGFIPPIIYRKVKIPLTSEEKTKLATKEGKNQAFRSKLCRNAKNKYPIMEKLIKAPFTKQILIFTSRISHAEKIYEYLESKQIESTLLVGSVVNNAKERETVLQKFRDKKIHILILVKMLNEGFDAPADTVIIVSGSKNKRDHIQRCGRTTRLGHIAKIFELVVDRDDLDTEEEIAAERDISNVIQPWIQDKLVEKIDKKLLRDIEDLVGTSNYRSVKSEEYEFEITSSDLL